MEKTTHWTVKKGYRMLGANAPTDCIPFFMPVEKFFFIEKNAKVDHRPCFDFFLKNKMEGKYVLL